MTKKGNKIVILSVVEESRHAEGLLLFIGYKKIVM